MTYSGDSGVLPDRLKEFWDRIRVLHNDLNGMREWGTHMEQRISGCRRDLDALSEAARNMFDDLAGYKRDTAKQLAALEARIAKLEDGGDVDD